eukprot:gene18230-biopygen20429
MPLRSCCQLGGLPPPPPPPPWQLMHLAQSITPLLGLLLRGRCEPGETGCGVHSEYCRSALHDGAGDGDAGGGGGNTGARSAGGSVGAVPLLPLPTNSTHRPI